MRSFIRMIALASLIATSLFWFTQGAHTDWTRRVPYTARVEPLTGIEVSRKLPRIIPGIDFLGGSIAVVACLLGLSFYGGARHGRRNEQLVPLAEPATGEPGVAETEPEPVESEPETEHDDDRANRLT